MPVEERTVEVQRKPRKRPRKSAVHPKLRKLLDAIDISSPFRMTCSILDLTLLERLREGHSMTAEEEAAVEKLYEKLMSLKRPRKRRSKKKEDA